MEEATFSPSGSIRSTDNQKKKRKKKKVSKRTSHNGDSEEKPKQSWSFQGMVKGSVTARCLWTACRAVFIGIFLILIGAAMATLGFYAKVLSTSEVHRGNVSVLATDETKFLHLDNLTYVGPCIMGIGGVIIVGACVMTFEARDTASKITPWFKLPSWASSRYSKVEVHPPGAQPYCTDVKLICTPANELEAAKIRIKAEFMEFREKVNSMDNKSNELSSKVKNGKLQRSSTEPNLAAENKKPGPTNCDSKDISLNLQIKCPTENSNMLQVVQPHHKILRRQAVSMDCNSEFPPVHRSYSNNSASQKNYKRGDSDDSMVMDLYLPQGSVTLKIRDTSKSGGLNSSLQKIRTPSECSQENRRSISPSPLSYVSALSQKAASPSSEDGLLSVPALVFKSKLKLEKSQSSDSGSRNMSKSPIPKQRLMLEGKSQSSDDGYLRVPCKKPMEMSSRGSSISSEDSFRTPSPRPFNKQRFGGSSISSEDGSLGMRHPNLSVQSGSYSSQDSYTIPESPLEDIDGKQGGNEGEENDVLLDMPSSLPLQAVDKPAIRKFQSVQEPQTYDQRISDEGQKRASHYRSKTESAKRHPLLRQSAVDS